MLFDTENWINITVIWSLLKPQRGNGQCGQRDPWCTYRSQAGDEHYLLFSNQNDIIVIYKSRWEIIIIVIVMSHREEMRQHREVRTCWTEVLLWTFISNNLSFFLPIEQKWNLNDTLACSCRELSWENIVREDSSLTMFLGRVPWRLEGFARI